MLWLADALVNLLHRRRNVVALSVAGSAATMPLKLAVTMSRWPVATLWKFCTNGSMFDILYQADRR